MFGSIIVVVVPFFAMPGKVNRPVLAGQRRGNCVGLAGKA
jgi:hypothetical protein